MRRASRLVGGFAIALLITTGCSQANEGANDSTTPGTTEETKTASAGDKASFYMEAADQETGGDSLTVKQVVLTGSSGYVAIHSDSGGAPGPVIGVSELLAAGTHDEVRVTLKEPLSTTVKVFPMLHLEDNGNSTYDFPNGDAPAKVADKVVVFSINLEVEK